MPLDEAHQKGLLVWLEDEYYQTYRKAMNENPLLIPDGNTDISIVYTQCMG
ncbi:phosphomannomutase [Vibrio ishigakensis]|uniref:Phosphomannomutase n=1 Tax=Vibrio ishigakensis TaxID=1481914 RepID=A0A0B8PB66_9VIBR|nr:phosphomannomutase [Vibrio ishigakensis]